jgi:disease resistance protein RPM1
MDLAIGALGSLLPKLGELLKQELDFLKGVKEDLEFLEGELSNIHGALGKIAEAPRDEVSPEDKIWAGNLRELSYDMEDVVDSFLLSVDGSEGDPNNPNTKTFKFKRLMEMINLFNLFKQAKVRRQIATAIKDFREQAEQVASWHKR